MEREGKASGLQEEQIVVFQLGGESYGIDIARVQEIKAMSAITGVPRAPEFVEGVINLRGVITPVVNMHSRFGRPRADYSKETRIIVVSMEGGEWVGLIVDSVSEVMRLAADSVEDAPGLVATVESEFVRGIAKVGEERLVILLDLDKMLAATRELALGIAA
ncbi:MAG: chemotaxis protein CheW [Anaerolineae bacterium]